MIFRATTPDPQFRVQNTPTPPPPHPPHQKKNSQESTSRLVLENYYWVKPQILSLQRASNLRRSVEDS